MGQRRIITGLALVAGLVAATLAATPAPAEPAWIPAEAVSPAGTDASEPRIVDTVSGRFVALWYDVGGARPVVLASTRGPADLAWGAPVPLSDPTSTASDLVVDASPSGRVTAVWVSTTAGGTSIQASTSAQGLSWTATTLSPVGEDVDSPDVDAGPTGDTAVVWQRRPAPTPAVPNPDLQIPLRILRTGVTAWESVTPVETRTTTAFQPRVAIDGRDETTVAWHNSGGQGERILATVWRHDDWEAIYPLRGTPAEPAPTEFVIDADHWTTHVAWSIMVGAQHQVELIQKPPDSWWQQGIQVLSGVGENAVDPAMAATDQASMVIAWRRDGPTEDQIWVEGRAGSSAVPVDRYVATLDQVSAPVVSVAREHLAVAWSGSDDGAPAQASVTSSEAGAPWSPTRVVPGPGGAPLRIAVDAFGEIATTWVADDGTNDRARAVILDADGPVPLLARPVHLVRGRTPAISLHWALPDWRGLAVEAQRLQVQRIGRTTSPWRDVGGVSTSSRSLRYAGRPGNTYCFRLQATAADSVSAWSDTGCSTTAIDDRSGVGRHWTRRGVPADYQGTLSVATRKGASLTFPERACSEVWLLARTAPGSGKVTVRRGAQRVATVSLASRVRARVAIPLTTEDPECGPLSVVSRSRKPVRIDGLYLVQPMAR